MDNSEWKKLGEKLPTVLTAKEYEMLVGIFKDYRRLLIREGAEMQEKLNELQG